MTSTFEELEFREGFAGGCYVNGTATCLAQPEDICDEGTFVSAHYVRANSGHPLRYCAGDLEDVLIGRCGDSGRCSNLASNCEDSSTFEEFDVDCTITQDLLSETYVTYGKCGDRCVWSPEDCLEGESYIRNDADCTADKVEIGACFAGHAFCAVGPKSCTQPGLPDEPYWSHQKVKELVGANCFLSGLPEPPTTAPPTRMPTTALPTNTRFPTQRPIVSALNPSTDDDNYNIGVLDITSDKRGLPTSGLVAIVAVVAVMLGIAIGVGTVYCKRWRQEAMNWRFDKDREQSVIPTEIVETSNRLECAESVVSEL